MNAHRKAKLVCILLLLVSASFREAPAPTVEDGVAVYFSPHGGCTEAVVAQIGKATKTIDVQAYSFTSAAIARALAAAAGRGVKVRAILDQKATGERGAVARYLAGHGVWVRLDGSHPIAHNKVVLIDGDTVITGSFNFTRQAESNAENLLIIEGRPRVAQAFEGNFQRHLGHSQRMEDGAEKGAG